MTSRAFTLVELITAIAIVVILVGIGFGAWLHVITAARSMTTSVRIEEVLRSLAGGGHDGGLVSASATGETSAAHQLHRLLRARDSARAPGVVDFKIDTRFQSWADVSYDAAQVASNTWTWTSYPWQNGPYPASEGHRFAFPWGAPPTDDPLLTATAPPGTTASFAIEDRGLVQLCPNLGADLMQAAGVLPEDDLTAFYTDRGRNRAWNDGWGRPLIIAFGLYQPPRNDRVVTREWYDINTSDITAGAVMIQNVTRQDYFLKRALKAYGFHRSIYLAVAALGPRLPSDLSEADVAEPTPALWSSPGGILERSWRTVNGIANTVTPTVVAGVVAAPVPSSELWRTEAAANPPRNPFAAAPWTGVRQGRGGGLRCFLSAPKDVR